MDRPGDESEVEPADKCECPLDAIKTRLLGPPPTAGAYYRISVLEAERDAALALNVAMREQARRLTADMNAALREKERLEEELAEPARQEADRLRQMWYLAIKRCEELSVDRDAWSAKCAELTTEIGRLRAAAPSLTPKPEHNPFRELRGDPRRIGNAV